MKATGIVRRVDPVGRIVVPKGIMKSLSIAPGDPVEFYVDDDKVVIKKYIASEDKTLVDKLISENAELKKRLELAYIGK